MDEMDEKLEYHLRMEDLVLETARRFLALNLEDDLDDAIRGTLEDFGRFADVDMVYLFQVDAGDHTATMTHRWSAPTVVIPEAMVHLRLDEHRVWTETLRAGRAHVIPDVAALRRMDGIRRSMQEYGVRSSLTVPLSVAETLTGWIGLASIRRQRHWTPEERKLMHFAAHTVSQTLRRHRNERALSHSEARFRAFLHQNPDAMYVLELDPPMATWLPEGEQVERILSARVVLCNQAGEEELTAGQPREVVGQPLGDLIGGTYAPETLDVLRRDSLALVRNGYWIHVDEAPRVHLDGSVTWVTRRAHGVIDGDHVKTIWASSRDITHEKEARDERERLAKRLQHSERLESIGLLAGGVAHDFNNLLLAILGNADLAAMDPSDTSRVVDCLREIRRAGQRAAELTRQLLAFSRKQPTDKKPLDVNQLLGSTTRMLQRLLPESIEIDLVPGHELGTTLADEAQLEQLVLNLCLNARDAMPHGGRLTLETQNVRINGEYCRSHAWARPGRYVLLTVTDTGEGIPEEDLDHIFEPFFTTKGRSRGTGLGLATAYGIVQQHDGMIHVYSERHVGTTFKVYLPITEQVAARVGPEVRPAPQGGRETILLAEDEGQVRTVAARILERAGYTVMPVADGAEAAEAFAAEPSRFDLVLLDVVMPNINGREACRRMREVRPSVPVIFSSGYTGELLDDVALGELGGPVLHKPYDPDQLLQAVRQALDEPAEERQKE